jgi:hypothetical protein
VILTSLRPSTSKAAVCTVDSTCLQRSESALSRCIALVLLLMSTPCFCLNSCRWNEQGVRNHRGWLPSDTIRDTPGSMW